MQVGNVTAGSEFSSTLANPADPALAAKRRGGNGVGLKPNENTDSAVAAEILARYDVTDITPREFSEMVQKLYDEGVLSQQELQQLTTVRHDLDLEGVDADESIDLHDFYTRLVHRAGREMENHDDGTIDRPRVSPMQHRLNWIEKFALIQAAPESLGLNALA